MAELNEIKFSINTKIDLYRLLDELNRTYQEIDHFEKDCTNKLSSREPIGMRNVVEKICYIKALLKISIENFLPVASEKEEQNG